MERVKYLAWFSCGVTSAAACLIALEKFGVDNVHLAYIHINSQHPDNDRFIKAFERATGAKVHIYQHWRYKDQFEVIEKEQYINGPAGAKCTSILKKDVRRAIEKELNPEYQIFGFEFTKHEINRAIRFQQQHPGISCIYPLIEFKINKNRAGGFVMDALRAELPKMYGLGFNNNNCIGCVKGSKNYWLRVKEFFPDKFERMAKLERRLDRTCLKDRQFLDELKPGPYKVRKPRIQSCDLFCEIEFAHIMDPATELIFKGELSLNQVT